MSNAVQVIIHRAYQYQIPAFVSINQLIVWSNKYH